MLHKRDSLENGRADEGGGEGEIVWKRREEVVAREKAEALERQRLAEYIVWQKREDFQEKREGRERTGRKSLEKGSEAAPEVIWKRRGEEEEEEEEAGRERARAIQRGHEIIWRKRERE